MTYRDFFGIAIGVVERDDVLRYGQVFGPASPKGTSGERWGTRESDDCYIGALVVGYECGTRDEIGVVLDIAVEAKRFLEPEAGLTAIEGWRRGAEHMGRGDDKWITILSCVINKETCAEVGSIKDETTDGTAWGCESVVVFKASGWDFASCRGTVFSS